MDTPTSNNHAKYDRPGLINVTKKSRTRHALGKSAKQRKMQLKIIEAFLLIVKWVLWTGVLINLLMTY